GAVQLVYCGFLQAHESRVQSATQDVKDVLHTGLSVGRHPPQVGTANEDGPRSHCQRLEDVAAATDAAVHEDLDLVPDGVDDGRQSADGRRGAVQVVATVVRHRDRGGPG